MDKIMDILNRSDAKTLGLSQYYTGKPCKNGHIAYRYTGSGACAECISVAANKRTSENRASRIDHTSHEQRVTDYHAEQARRKAALAGVVLIRVLADPRDLQTIDDTAVAVSLARDPTLQPADVGGIRLYKPGSPLHTLRVTSADAQLIYDTAAVLWLCRQKLDFSHIHRRLEAQGAIDSGPALPDWTEKP